MRLLILPIYDWAEFSAAPFVIDFIALVVVVSLWTAYLLRSQRCRLRYPKSPGEAIRRVFE